ncbi:hypothetical protein CE91St30_23520 [Raoultibacter timonensis]|uniref:HTH lysR-type domain-containing protein n=1 Tax=Raoultibacter timonensis TaxID=1907662 RepID=A0ABM7WKW3_9ACTN|nr:hypothetical protein CE91St30_23520 [Raoultibacter timonensis]BDF51623.1 hypothetical protein CE91St31_23530 [Raoultibacter timonensis]
MKASKRLFITQPALTKQIARLESDLGVRLFERSTRSVALTDQGDIFLPAAKAALGEIDAAVADMRHARETKERSLSVGFVYLFLSHPVERWLEDYCSSHPEVVVKVEERDVLGLIELLVGGSLDAAVLGVTDPSLLPDSLNRLAITTVTEQILVWEDHPLASRDYATIDDIIGEKFVYPYIKPTTIISPLQRDLKEKGANIEYVQAGFDSNTFQLVEEKRAITAIPNSHLPIEQRIISVPYRSDYENRVYLLWDKSNGKRIVENFVRYISKRIREI